MTVLSNRFSSFLAAFPTPSADGVVPEDVEICRMNLNESPYGPSPKALAAATQALTGMNRYPDHTAGELVHQIAVITGVPADCISVGNGSGEILMEIARLVIAPGDSAVFPNPTFAMCSKGVSLAGGTPIDVPVRENGTIDIEAMLAAVTDSTRLFYMCTPNNPTGGVSSADDLALAARKVPKECLLVVDEAYFEFAHAEGGPDVLSILRNRKGPWIVTRSFSKAYCLAGLRVGYALCSNSDVRNALWYLRPSFNVSGPAIAAACTALADAEHLTRVVKGTLLERNRVARALVTMGCMPFPGTTNFLTFKPGGAATALAAELRAQGILVRAIQWPDADGSIRITLGTHGENDRFLAVLSSLLDR